MVSRLSPRETTPCPEPRLRARDRRCGQWEAGLPWASRGFNRSPGRAARSLAGSEAAFGGTPAASGTRPAPSLLLFLLPPGRCPLRPVCSDVSRHGGVLPSQALCDPAPPCRRWLHRAPKRSAFHSPRTSSFALSSIFLRQSIFFTKAGTPPNPHSSLVLATSSHTGGLCPLVPSCLRPTCLCGAVTQCRPRPRTTHTGPRAQSLRPGSFVGTLEGAGLGVSELTGNLSVVLSGST